MALIRRGREHSVGNPFQIARKRVDDDGGLIVERFAAKAADISTHRLPRRARR